VDSEAKPALGRNTGDRDWRPSPIAHAFEPREMSPIWTVRKVLIAQDALFRQRRWSKADGRPVHVSTDYKDSDDEADYGTKGRVVVEPTSLLLRLNFDEGADKRRQAQLLVRLTIPEHDHSCRFQSVAE
jgi:hypothetical protein